MMVKLEFELPEEREEFDLAVNGYKYLCAIQDYHNWLRNQYKYDAGEMDPGAADKASEKLFSCLEEHGVSVWD